MTSNNPPGLILPTQSSYAPGAGNPRDSAMMATQAMNAKQNSLSNAVGGKRHRKYRGGADSVTVPQYPMLYHVPNGPGTTPNDQIAGLSSTSMQGRSWASSDSKAVIKGGRHTRKSKKGGNSDWVWGCYSGGKRRRTIRKRVTKRRNSRRR